MYIAQLVRRKNFSWAGVSLTKKVLLQSMPKNSKRSDLTNLNAMVILLLLS